MTATAVRSAKSRPKMAGLRPKSGFHLWVLLLKTGGRLREGDNQVTKAVLSRRPPDSKSMRALESAVDTITSINFTRTPFKHLSGQCNAPPPPYTLTGSLGTKPQRRGGREGCGCGGMPLAARRRSRWSAWHSRRAWRSAGRRRALVRMIG
eukprot:scaffold5873_cov66-Phaeocystis_antarctica.AAC.2